MRTMATWAGLLCIVSACSSSDGSSGSLAKAKSCTTDADCPSGQGCKPEGSDSYCAPHCNADTDCPYQQQCAGQTDAPSQKCKTETVSDGGTELLCDLFNGAYGPNTCK